jgi:hypothetical protein
LVKTAKLAAALEHRFWTEPGWLRYGCPGLPRPRAAVRDPAFPARRVAHGGRGAGYYNILK